MFLATWEVCIVKNCHEVLKCSVLEAEGRGQHFQAQVHSFSLYGPKLSWQN